MKKLLNPKFGLVLVLLLVAFLPMIVMAQIPPPPGIYVPDVGLPGSPTTDAGGLIQRVIMRLLLPFAGIVAVLFVIIGGFQYMLAGANEDLAKKGKNTLQNALLGLIIVILSYVIVTVITNTLMRQL